jgi:hypothetical protein
MSDDLLKRKFFYVTVGEQTTVAVQPEIFEAALEGLNVLKPGWISEEVKITLGKKIFKMLVERTYNGIIYLPVVS